MYIFLTILMSYILGSIPTALIIGKVFFKKDIRQYGSGNLGGSNTGRVLGKKIGFLVMVLDILKAVIAIFLTKLIINHTNPDLLNLSIYLSSAFVLIGHCYTCFANFKGGKAVASSFGILFITRETNSRPDAEDVIRHEYGHTIQLKQLGIVKYALCIGIPSLFEWGSDPEYYRRPWEITADIYGNVQSRSYPGYEDAGFQYLENSGKWGIFVWFTIE